MNVVIKVKPYALPLMAQMINFVIDAIPVGNVVAAPV